VRSRPPISFNHQLFRRHQHTWGFPHQVSLTFSLICGSSGPPPSDIQCAVPGPPHLAPLAFLITPSSGGGANHCQL